jgi:hypothetical protein
MMMAQSDSASETDAETDAEELDNDGISFMLQSPVAEIEQACQNRNIL